MLGRIDEGWGVSGWLRGIIGAVFAFLGGFSALITFGMNPTASGVGYAIGVLLITYGLFRVVNGTAQAVTARAID